MPGYRGRLIWPMFVDIGRLDTAGVAALPGEGETSGGYDFDFREPIVQEATGSLARVEILTAQIPTQVMTERGDYDRLNMAATGDLRNFNLSLAFHYVDLETYGLIDSDGSCLFKVNDRLLSLYDGSGTLIRDYSTQDIHATQVQDRSFGLSGLARNLCLVRFESRDKGQR